MSAVCIAVKIGGIFVCEKVRISIYEKMEDGREDTQEEEK